MAVVGVSTLKKMLFLGTSTFWSLFYAEVSILGQLYYVKKLQLYMNNNFCLHLVRWFQVFIVMPIIFKSLHIEEILKDKYTLS